MKIVEKFTDLDKALAYITEINAEYTTLVAEKKAEADRAKLLEKALTEANSNITSLTALKEGHILEIQGLNDRISVLDNGDIDSLKDELNGANAIIADLGAQLAALSEISAPDKKVVSIKGDQYVLTGTDFLIPGVGPKKLDELAADEKLLEKLLAKGSSILTPVS